MTALGVQQSPTADQCCAVANGGFGRKLAKPHNGQNNRIEGIETATTRISKGNPMRQ